MCHRGYLLVRSDRSPLDSSHGARNLAAVFVASYPDQPGGETPQTGSDEVVIAPNP